MAMKNNFLLRHPAGSKAYGEMFLIAPGESPVSVGFAGIDAEGRAHLLQRVETVGCFYSATIFEDEFEYEESK